MKIKKFSPSGKKPEDKDDSEKKSRRRDADGSERVNRTVYLTVATLLIILAVAVALTSAANRARRGESTGSAEPPVTAAPSTDAPVTRPPETVPPDDTGAGATEPDIPVADVVPTFVLPAQGRLGDAHDPTAQVFSDTMKDWRVHLGIDIQSNVGEPVYAAADGIVTQIWDDPLYGKSITIGHTGKAVTVYKNLGETLGDGIEIGKEVKAGQIIGAVGDGAIIELAEEPHLHFEVKIDDVSVNPLDYLSKSAIKSLEDDTSFEH